MEYFDWKYYLENNKDLIENGINNLEDSYNHWKNFGKMENRKYKIDNCYILENYFKKLVEYQLLNELTKEDSWDLLINIYNKINAEEEETVEEYDKEIDLDNFDWKYYIDKNEDLRNSGILTKELALKHWTIYGKIESRPFRPLIINKISDNIDTITIDNFDWKFYASNNLDLIDNNIISKEELWNHWINFGKFENREFNIIENISDKKVSNQVNDDQVNDDQNNDDQNNDVLNDQVNVLYDVYDSDSNLNKKKNITEIYNFKLDKKKKYFKDLDSDSESSDKNKIKYKNIKKVSSDEDEIYNKVNHIKFEKKREVIENKKRENVREINDKDLKNKKELNKKIIQREDIEYNLNDKKELNKKIIQKEDNYENEENIN